MKAHIVAAYWSVNQSGLAGQLLILSNFIEMFLLMYASLQM